MDSKTIATNSPVPEKLTKYRGNWSLAWVIYRYLKSAKTAMTFDRFLNASFALFEMKMGRIRISSKPFTIRIEPTNICNLRCPRCSCGIGSDSRQKGCISVDDYRIILEQCKRYGIIVRLDGNGEPMLHPKIFELIRITKSYNLSISISTNFNTKLCDNVMGFIDSGLDRLIVAIDGGTQESYEKYRVGGNLVEVEERLQNLLKARRIRRVRHPLIVVQFLDWGYNHDEIPKVRDKVRGWGVERFEVISPDWAVENAKANPVKPRRCFWLWTVLTVDWDLNYKACTNAWTLSWPRINMRDLSMDKFLNCDFMQEARRYNIDKSSEAIASDEGCHCNACSDMLVIGRPPGYVCE